MVSLTALWLPIVLSAVLVFITSSVIHMLLRYHRSDLRGLPDEAAARAVLGKQDLAPGQYYIPYCTHADMRSPETMKKFEEGPVVILTVLRKGPVRLGPHLVKWFLFSLGVSWFVAYLTSRTLMHGTPYLQVFRVASTIAWLGYAGALVWTGIWKGVPWSSVLKDAFDGLLFALVTGGSFGAFWPK